MIRGLMERLSLEEQRDLFFRLHAAALMRPEPTGRSTYRPEYATKNKIERAIVSAIIRHQQATRIERGEEPTRRTKSGRLVFRKSPPLRRCTLRLMPIGWRKHGDEDEPGWDDIVKAYEESR